MIRDWRIAVCLVLSLGAHVAFARALRRMPPRLAAPVPRTIALRVFTAPTASPPPEPALPPPAPAEKPPASKAKTPTAPTRVRVPHPVFAETPPVAAPPSMAPAAPGVAVGPGRPVFGVSMSSTSEAGGGPTMPVGTPGGQPGSRGGGSEAKGTKEGGAPVAAYEVTEMPLPKRRCTGKYTEAAMQAGIEGTVILALVIGADGHVRDVHVVQGLGHGLDEAAIAAMKACPFTPGRRGNEAVPVRIPEFKVHFFQNEP